MHPPPNKHTHKQTNKNRQGTKVKRIYNNKESLTTITCFYKSYFKKSAHIIKEYSQKAYKWVNKLIEKTCQHSEK